MTAIVDSIVLGLLRGRAAHRRRIDHGGSITRRRS